MTELELSRRERKKEETKDRIFNAAMKLFKHNGLDGTTVDEIAEKADVAKGTFFNYFPRKEAVFGYLPEMWVAEAEAKAVGIVNGPGPAIDGIIDMLVQFAAFYEGDRVLSRWVAMEWMRREQSGCDDICRRWDDLGTRLVAHMQDCGELRRDVPPESAAEMFAAVHRGTIMRWLASPEPLFPLRDELRKRMKLIVEGLSPRSGGVA